MDGEGRRATPSDDARRQASPRTLEAPAMTPRRYDPHLPGTAGEDRLYRTGRDLTRAMGRHTLDTNETVSVDCHWNRAGQSCRSQLTPPVSTRALPRASARTGHARTGEDRTEAMGWQSHDGRGQSAADGLPPPHPRLRKKRGAKSAARHGSKPSFRRLAKIAPNTDAHVGKGSKCGQNGQNPMEKLARPCDTWPHEWSSADSAQHPCPRGQSEPPPVAGSSRRDWDTDSAALVEGQGAQSLGASRA
jgi:hypothetical protein